jgi:ribosomal protein S8
MHFLSNLITSLSNANSAKLNSISFKISTKNEFNYIFQILKILQKEGRIRGFTFNHIKAAKFKTKSAEFIIYLKYNERGLNVIKSIFLVSKTSRPVYRKTKSF